MPRVDIRNISRFWNDRTVPGLSLMCADFTTQEYAPHWHEAFVVAATEAGGAEFRSRGAVDYARSSVLLVFNPAEPHSGRMGWSERWRYRSLYVARRAIRALADGLGIESVPHFTSNVVEDEVLAGGFLALHRALEDGRDPLSERELLYRSFGRLFERYGSGGGRIADAPADRAVAAAVVDYMRAHYDKALSLDDMGRRFQLTPYQLIRSFRKTVGLTPHAYLTQVRLNAACRRLRRGEAISEAAAAVGFYDQSALTRHFKRSYGITPLQFARAATNCPTVGRQNSPIPGGGLAPPLQA